MNNDILARYESAQTFLHPDQKLVLNDSVFPHWIDDHSFWYKKDTHKGHEFRLVNAQSATNNPAFDHQALADALLSKTNTTVNPDKLPLTDLTIKLSAPQLHFHALDKEWLFDPISGSCEEIAKESGASQQVVVSPDGKNAVFIREHNLWLQDQTSHKEKQLTHDGSEDCSYARPNPFADTETTMRGMDCDIQALWSKDSKRILTSQFDTRNVTVRDGIMFVPDEGSRSKTTSTMMSYAGDEFVERNRIIVIDVANETVKKADYPALPFIQFHDVMPGLFTAGLGWWSDDNQRAFFIDITSGSKKVSVVELNTHTGDTKTVFEETADPYVKLRHSVIETPIIAPLTETNELVWISGRSNWMHLYLYDLNTGELKHQITGKKTPEDTGHWHVRQILHCDVEKRELIIQTSGRNPDISPYYRDVCKVNIDTGVLTPLVTGDFEHIVHYPEEHTTICRWLQGIDSVDVEGLSPSGQYVVSTRSRVDTVPVTVLHDRLGKEIMTIELADVSGLPEDWHWPEPVKLTGADGKTDIYGVVFRPPGFSPDHSYPVIDYDWSGRILSCLPQGAFSNNTLSPIYMHAQAFAALGFIVVMIEGRGTPLRDNAFHYHHYGDPAFGNDFADRIAGTQQLAQRYPYMDVERVGISSPEMPTNGIFGILNHPDFYKVCVRHCLYDARDFSNPMAEFNGIIGNDNPAPYQYAEDSISAFTGKLFLIQGMSFGAGSPMFRLVEALQKANKDVDMLCIPNMMSEIISYTQRREWDYLVKHLQGVEPPKEFPLVTFADSL